MTFVDRYFAYLKSICEGERIPPEGICLTETEPERRAAALQAQIQAIGAAEFVRRCDRQDGLELSEEEYLHEDELRKAFASLLQQEQSAAPVQIDEPDGPRSAYEVLLDCCCLDEKLLYYLIDVLKRGEEREFQRLALVTTRKAFSQKDFLFWFASKPSRAGQDELICVTLMDACFDRLAAEGQPELIAALLCGDQTTFELFRCEAPELRHLPDATFAWFEQNYLQGYYPIRYMLKYNGVAFPKEVPV